MKKNSDNKDIVENSESKLEDCVEDNPIQEFPTRESETEDTKDSESYTNKEEVVYKS